MNQTITLHAKERGGAPSDLPRSTRAFHTAFYDITILPAAPLRVGQRVQINTLKPIPNPGSGGQAAQSQKWYSSTPTNIVGVIVGVRAMELAITEFIVLNEAPQSLIKHAYLTIQHIQGATVHLELPKRIARTALLALLAHTRHVPIERNAVVVLEDEPSIALR